MLVISMVSSFSFFLRYIKILKDILIYLNSVNYFNVITLLRYLKLRLLFFIKKLSSQRHAFLCALMITNKKNKHPGGVYFSNVNSVGSSSFFSSSLSVFVLINSFGISAFLTSVKFCIYSGHSK